MSWGWGGKVARAATKAEPLAQILCIGSLVVIIRKKTEIFNWSHTSGDPVVKW